MIKVNLPPLLLGRMSDMCKTAVPATRFMALAALIFINSALAVVCTAQRTDNRRLFWTGSSGNTWDNSTASWMTTGSFLAYVNTNTTSAVWLTTIPGIGEPVTAIPNATFIGGDVVIFDSFSDAGGYTWTGSMWVPPVLEGELQIGDVFGTTRTITIADEGVTVSDVVVNAVSHYAFQGTTFINNYVFTGGAITADPSRILPESVQITGTGAGLAAPSTRPTGSLIKLGGGRLTLSNTAANHFPGGIHLIEGSLSVTDSRALGDNCIIVGYIVNAGGIEERYGTFIGERLIDLVQRPGVTSSGGNMIPASVISSGGELMTTPFRGTEVTLHVASEAAGIDITGDIFLSNRTVIFNIEGDTTISGLMIGNPNDYGAAAGTIVKNGPGTLTLSGTRNWFYGSGKLYNQLNEGRVVITSPHALGIGATSVNPGAILEFRGVVGTMRQAFVGGGDVEITGGSDVTFNWRNGTLDGFDGMSGNGSWHPAMNNLGNVTVSGQSRFSAIASGTYTTVLGGAGVYVKVTEGSTLVIGREGLTAEGNKNTKIPMTYAVLANRIDLSGGSTIVLKPNAYLSTGALIVTDDSTNAITFGGSGVSRLRWQEGMNPDSITTTGTSLRYIVPAGMKLYIKDIPVPVSPQQSVPADSSASGWCREYVLVNQGTNPLKDIAMTMNAISALHDTLSSRLADELVDPVANHTPSRGRKWVNEGWVRYIHSEIEYDAGGITTPGMDGRISNVVAGFDGLLPGRVLLGIHAGMGENNLDTTNNTNLRSKQKSLGLHAAQRFGRLHIAAVADTGRVSTDSFRYEGDSIIRGKWDTTYYSASLEAGASFSPWQKTILRPFASLRYSNLKISGHNEKGDSSLIVANFSDTTAQAAYGLTVGCKPILFKRDLALDLSLSRKHSIKTPRSTLTTHFLSAPGTPVELERGDYYSDIIAGGLSVRLAVSRHTIVGLAADYETASSYNRMTGTFLIGYTW